MVEPTSSVLINVNDPLAEDAEVPSQARLDPPCEPSIVALPPAAERMPPTVASEVVPFPVGEQPLSPGPLQGPVAETDATLGPRRAIPSMDATATQPRMRNRDVRGRCREKRFLLFIR